MRKFLFIIAAILLIVNSSESFANTTFERCNISVNPKIIFKSSYGKLKYDYTKSNKELQKMSGKKIWGLASVKYKSSSKSTYSLRERNGGECLVPKEIEIYIGMTTPTIYVSNDLESGSCNFNLVLRHEETHMQINVRTFEHFLRVVPPNLKKAYKDIKPILVKKSSKYTMQEAVDQQTQEYNYIVQNFTQQLQDETDIEHEKLDGDKGREIENKVCKKRIKLH
ncbi:MAG: hypothetical protein LBR70_03445 [Lactobacillaceae bacterium]|jgi:hypothetical protein|nr:hypothetical protein [Lactobacillaceae bacterium]